MEALHIYITVCVVILLLAFSVFIYNREVRNGIIMEDFREDFELIKKTVYSCTPADAEALIFDFERKWSVYIDPITLSNYTYQLYKIIFKKHGDAALN